MRPLLILTALLFPLVVQAQEPSASENNPPLTILNARWSRDRQPAENAVSVSVPPVAAVTANDKAFARQRRANDPAGVRDPNADSIDTRSSELERIVQQSREPQPVEGFAYQIRVQNGSERVTQTVFWEYQFAEIENPSHVTRRQFLCAIKMKPQQEKDLRVFGLRGPTDVVDVKSLGKSRQDQFKQTVLINRVEYSDGTFWQRKEWSLDNVKLTAKARSQAGSIPVCRSL